MRLLRPLWTQKIPELYKLSETTGGRRQGEGRQVLLKPLVYLSTERSSTHIPHRVPPHPPSLLPQTEGDSVTQSLEEELGQCAPMLPHPPPDCK